MENNSILIRETASVSDLADRAILAVVDGAVDPLTAWINTRKMKMAIERFEKDDRIRDITQRGLSKYGKRQQFGDCILEEAEMGVRYDFSVCNDSELSELYRMRDDLSEVIKAREDLLKSLPASGMADPQTGEIVYPPARSSKTVIKTTFKNK